MSDAFDLPFDGWLLHGSLVAWVAALVTGHPRHVLGTPDRRAVGWLALGFVLGALGPPVLMARGRPGVAVACLACALGATYVAWVLWRRRPVGAVKVELGDAVEARDGFTGRVVQVGPWDYAVTVRDTVGDERVYPTDEVRKINASRSNPQTHWKGPSVRSTRLITIMFVVVVAAVVAVVAFARPARAWPTPIVAAAGGACTAGTRTPVVWTITNLETEFPRSPAVIVDVTVSPSFPTRWTSPITLPNTGHAQATAETVVPPGFAGKVALSFTLKWSGQDGADERSGYLAVTMGQCRQPSTVLQSTTSTSSTATSSTTSTTVAVLAETVGANPPAPVTPAATPVRATPAFTG